MSTSIDSSRSEVLHNVEGHQFHLSQNRPKMDINFLVVVNIYSMLEIFYMYLFYFSPKFSVHLQVLNW